MAIKDIARLTKGNDLPNEYVGETYIVGHRRNHRHVVIQADRGQRLSPDGDRVHKFDRDVLGIGRRAAVAANQELSPAVKAACQGEGRV